MDSYIDVNPAMFQTFKKEVGNHPVVMLNLLKYKARVEETGETGKEAYAAYLNAAAPFLDKVNASVLFFGTPKHMLIGPEDEALWDAMILVKYQSFSDFMNMATAKGYPSEMRARALADSRLIHCKSIHS